MFYNYEIKNNGFEDILYLYLSMKYEFSKELIGNDFKDLSRRTKNFINANKISVFCKGDKKLEELVYKVVPGVLLPEKNDPLLKELETTLDSLALDTDSKWFERYGFKPVLVNINIMNWIRTFTTSYIHVWLTENDKWQAKALWYRARGRASMTSKECDSYQDALKEILPGIKELFERENRKLKK